MPWACPWPQLLTAAGGADDLPLDPEGNTGVSDYGYRRIDRGQKDTSGHCQELLVSLNSYIPGNHTPTVFPQFCGWEDACSRGQNRSRDVLSAFCTADTLSDFMYRFHLHNSSRWMLFHFTGETLKFREKISTSSAITPGRTRVSTWESDAHSQPAFSSHFVGARLYAWILNESWACLSLYRAQEIQI